MNPHLPFAARLLSVTDIAENTRLFRFRAENNTPATFVPGQFFLLQVDEKTNRAYSIASSPDELPDFDLIVKYVESGAASTYLWHLDAGKDVFFRGPLGRFGIKHPDKKQLFIATGTGLAPLRSFYKSLLAKPDTTSVTLIFGVRHEKNLFCLEEFKKFTERHPDKFNVRICLSQPQEAVSAQIYTGRVTGCVAETLHPEDLGDTEVSLCGSREMVTEIKQILHEKGVPNQLINEESW